DRKAQVSDRTQSGLAREVVVIEGRGGEADRGISPLPMSRPNAPCPSTSAWWRPTATARAFWQGLETFVPLCGKEPNPMTIWGARPLARRRVAAGTSVVK